MNFFLLQDRGQKEVTSMEFNGVPFQADFIDSTSGFIAGNNIASSDGFKMNVDPLFSVRELPA